MILSEKIINYKILDLINLYNFDIKFGLIRDHMKKLYIFCMGSSIEAGHATTYT